MNWFRLAVLVGTAYLCLGCWPVPKVDQTDFCYADIAFTVEITHENVTRNKIEYDYDIKTIHKGNPKRRKLVGRGISNSCGPEVLIQNAIYLIYAKTDDEGDFLQIVSYKDITDVTYSDFERMENYYDCSCKIKFDYPAYAGPPGWPSSGLSDPPVTECKAPFSYCRRSGYCKSIEGKCTWGNHGDCY